MPDLDTTLHLDMLKSGDGRRTLRHRLWSAYRHFRYEGLYGTEWGDPDIVDPLKFVRDRYLLPYVNPEHTALEIGPGGGRWTRYMVPFKRLYVVDYYPELLAQLSRNLKQPNIVSIRNKGTDLDGVPDRSIDYAFSFGTFVHLDIPLIEGYLKNLGRVLKPTANVVIQYSDRTKIMARENSGFSDNTPDRMRQLVESANFRILEEDLTTLWHSSIVRFTMAGSSRDHN